MATVSPKSAIALNSAQRAWLKDMGVALGTPVADASKSPGGAAAVTAAPGAVQADAAEGFAPELLSLAPEIIKILGELGGGRRICVVEVVNMTSQPLRRGKATHESGNFNKKLPPDQIDPGKNAQFISASPEGNIPILNIPTEGAIGTMPWLTPNGGEWHIEWRNPVAGSVKAKTFIRNLDPKRFIPDELHGNGNTAEFRFTLTDLQAPPPKPTPTPGPTPNAVDIASSCSITITNETNVTLKLANQGQERGNFMSFPAKTLAPGASTNFNFVETTNNKDPKDEGCKGFVLWQVGSPNILWRVEWDNPEGEKNSAIHDFNPRNPGFDSINQIGQGDENVPVSFTITGGGGTTPPPPPPTTGKKLTMIVVEEADGKTSPVKNATVNVSNLSGKTPDNGKAEFALPPGSHLFQVTADGFQQEIGKVDVAADKDTEFTVKLKKQDSEKPFVPPPESKQPTLRMDNKQSSDGWVEYMQQLLRDNGAKITPNGIFDKTTQDAVKAFQKAQRDKGNPKFVVDGICGNQTWAALREGAPEEAGTDGRKPNTFVEKGVEARWTREGQHCIFIRSLNEASLLVNSVGDAPIDDRTARVHATMPGETKPKVFKDIKIGPPNQKMPSGAGHVHAVKLRPFLSDAQLKDPNFNIEAIVMEAFLEADLGGDNWKGKIQDIR